MMDRVSIVWPNQKSFGAHINISGRRHAEDRA
jgi:hypothetical protein